MFKWFRRQLSAVRYPLHAARYLLPISSAGFTIIELLIAITIGGLAATIGIARYQSFNNTQLGKNAVATLRNNLRDIQGRASAGIKPASGSCLTNSLDGYQVSIVGGQSYQAQAMCSGNPEGSPIPYCLPKDVVFTSPFPAFTFEPVAAGATASTITIKNNKNSICYSVGVTAGGDIVDSGSASCVAGPTGVCDASSLGQRRCIPNTNAGIQECRYIIWFGYLWMPVLGCSVAPPNQTICSPSTVSCVPQKTCNPACPFLQRCCNTSCGGGTSCRFFYQSCEVY